ncbi:hypothetical protein THOM_2541 [Trachipleistophora hominis]|uniref:Uncharacterized protein n=1 Tax=Trachipleistophora hominis TaxID=72359 RepID=L7JUB0_TRAHO|nr:hypothetical protein THOM_2541 [Trachipleistophora hominis]
MNDCMCLDDCREDNMNDCMCLDDCMEDNTCREDYRVRIVMDILTLNVIKLQIAPL